MALIEVRDLSRDFTIRKKVRRSEARGNGLSPLRRTSVVKHAVHDLSFEIDAGEMVGYIGPNGAGKSTTIKMLTGILVPSGGSARVAGLEPSRQRRELARRIGVVFGQRTSLWWDLPLRDSFELLRRIYRIPDKTFRRNLEDHVALLDLGDLMDTPVRQLSLGQRMRGDIAAALLHDPEVLYLDEPTIGLDVPTRTAIVRHIHELACTDNIGVLWATHLFDEVEPDDDLLVLNKGRIVARGVAKDVVAETGAGDLGGAFRLLIGGDTEEDIAA